MMALPFLALTLALAAGWLRWRVVALVLWLGALGLMANLYRLHATDALNLSF